MIARLRAHRPRACIGVKNLKIITFGPRPQDFFACNAPIKGLYELGVEIEENSELDLLVAFKEHENDPRIDDVCAEMAKPRWARAPITRISTAAWRSLS